MGTGKWEWEMGNGNKERGFGIVMSPVRDDRIHRQV